RLGVEFFQTFSPTPKMTTLWVLLHVAAQRDYELHSLDFSTTFLQGSLHEEIYLRRPVYGLRQAPREWHQTLRTMLLTLGFAPSTADLSLFLRTETSLPPFYVLVYVLQRFGFRYSSPQSTPLPTGHSLSAPPSDEFIEPSDPYPELVGCLMYMMTCTRPDLAYPLSILARYGYTFSLGSGSVSWQSTSASSVLSSSCEAEIYAGAMALQELRWLTYLLTDLGERPPSSPVLYQRGQLRLAYVATRANTADIFTKALQFGDHQPCFAFLDWSCDHLSSPDIRSTKDVNSSSRGVGGGKGGGGTLLKEGCARSAMSGTYSDYASLSCKKVLLEQVDSEGKRGVMDGQGAARGRRTSTARGVRATGRDGKRDADGTGRCDAAGQKGADATGQQGRDGTAGGEATRQQRRWHETGQQGRCDGRGDGAGQQGRRVSKGDGTGRDSRGDASVGATGRDNRGDGTAGATGRDGTSGVTRRQGRRDGIAGATRQQGRRGGRGDGTGQQGRRDGTGQQG
ncbi:unnamed protein product, partial [Closterium sp. NIES-53]